MYQKDIKTQKSKKKDNAMTKKNEKIKRQQLLKNTTT